MKILLSLSLAAVTSVCAAQSPWVELVWDPSPSTNVTNYRLWWGPLARSYTNSLLLGNVTNGTISNLIVGATYYISATAIDNHGVPSDYCNELVWTSLVPPPPVTIQTVTQSNGAPNVTLIWSPSAATNIVSYKIYFGAASRVYTNSLTVATTIGTVSNLVQGATYYFCVTPFDSRGCEGAQSAEVTWTVYVPPPAVTNLRVKSWKF